MYIVLSTRYICNRHLGVPTLAFAKESWGCLSDSVARARGLVTTVLMASWPSHFSLLRLVWGREIQFQPVLGKAETSGASRRDCPSWKDRGLRGNALSEAGIEVRQQPTSCGRSGCEKSGPRVQLGGGVWSSCRQAQLGGHLAQHFANKKYD